MDDRQQAHQESQRTQRRQQRRRAIIAWVTAAAVVLLIALGAVFGDDESDEPAAPVSFGYAMTAAQYDELETGLDEAEFVERLRQTGKPENLTPDSLVQLFPPHEGDLACTYWEISDHEGLLARVCFDADGELAQKVERDIDEEPVGVTV
ncbi:MAG: hypothetical protein ACOYD4_13960 [Solirubrobacterales bacterium]